MTWRRHGDWFIASSFCPGETANGTMTIFVATIAVFSASITLSAEVVKCNYTIKEAKLQAFNSFQHIAQQKFGISWS